MSVFNREHLLSQITHVASITTATPIGLMASSTARAICLVRRSCTCSLRENVSAIRASLDRPRTWPAFEGMYPMDTYFVIGQQNVESLE